VSGQRHAPAALYPRGSSPTARAKILITYFSNCQARKDNEDMRQTLILYQYNLNILKTESTSSVYKKRRDEKVGQNHFLTQQKNSMLIKSVHVAAKKALG
jgi:hypothetical protein